MQHRRETLWLDVLAFSGVLPAAVAAGLAAACGVVLLEQPSARGLAAPAVLAAAGTLVVYNVDRLRDLERDRATAPGRTHFVETHRGWVLGLTIAGVAASIPTALVMPPAVWVVCAAVLALGLWHRRLKGSAAWKVVYVTVAWLGVVVGLPVVAGGGADPGPLAIAVASLGVTIAANLMASELREYTLCDRVLRELAIARVLAILGTVLCLLDRSVWPLIPIAFGESLALLGFRSSERYGLVVVDGALLFGALASIALATSGL